MSTVNLADLARLAQVDSASLFTYSILGGPRTLLEVVAQSSGFNWRLTLQPGEPGNEPVEYFPYLVIETKIRPDWPKNAGIGPVVPPTTLHTYLTHYGTKGIEVIGAGSSSRKLDYPKAATA